MMSLLNQCSVLSKDQLIAPLCSVAASAISTSWITQTLLCLQHTCPWHLDTFQYGWMDSSIYGALHILELVFVFFSLRIGDLESNSVIE